MHLTITQDGQNMFRHNNASVHKANFIKTWFAYRLEQKNCGLLLVPLNNFVIKLTADVAPGLFTQHQCLTLSNALVVEFAQIPTATLQNLAESLP